MSALLHLQGLPLAGVGGVLVVAAFGILLRLAAKLMALAVAAVVLVVLLGGHWAAISGALGIHH